MPRPRSTVKQATVGAFKRTQGSRSEGSGLEAVIADAADELARKSEPYGRPLGPLPRWLQDRARDKKPEVEATTAPSSGPEAEPADAADELARKSGPFFPRARPLPYVPRHRHFGRKWLWRAASATSFGSAAAVIGFFGLLLLQLPSRPHLLTPTHIGETAAQAATAAPRAVEADPVNGTALPSGPTRAPR
jgi:hypothetical protein